MSIPKLSLRSTEDQAVQGYIWKEATAFQGSRRWDELEAKTSESSEVQLQEVYLYCQWELQAQGTIVANSKRPA